MPAEKLSNAVMAEHVAEPEVRRHSFVTMRFKFIYAAISYTYTERMISY